jgi:hypothetical protein
VGSVSFRVSARIEEVLSHAWTLAMNCFCSTRSRSESRKFTALLVHVAATRGSALRHSSAFVILLVQDFFKKCTQINLERVVELSDRFRNLEIDSRPAIRFEVKPKGFEAPFLCITTYQRTG